MREHADGILLVRVDQKDGVKGDRSMGNNEASAFGGENEICKGAALAANRAGFGGGSGDTNDGGARGDGANARSLAGDVCFKVAERDVSRNRDTVRLGEINIEDESTPCVGVEIACISAVPEAKTSEGRAKNRLGGGVGNGDSDVGWRCHVERSGSVSKERKLCEGLHRGNRCARGGIEDIESTGLGRGGDIDVERKIGIHISECT